MSERDDTTGTDGRSRREMMRLGAASIVGALAAGSLAPEAASANDGDPLILGSIGNTATDRTEFFSSSSGPALLIENTGHGSGISVTGGSFGSGLDAVATATGAPALTGTSAGGGPAILGSINGGGSVRAVDIGVQGSSGDSAGAGVFGENSAGGPGLLGESAVGAGVQGVTTTGTALSALATDPAGVALYVEGSSSFQSCGAATVKGTVAKPKSSVKVTLVNLSATSLVLTTIQTDNAPGTFVQSAVPNAETGSITITLNQAVTKAVKIAWFVIDPIPIA